MVADIIYQMCGYLDDIERKGFTARDKSRSGDTREACRNWAAGKCRKGDKYKFKHVGPKGSKGNKPEAPASESSGSQAPRSPRPTRPRQEGDSKGKGAGKHLKAGSTRCRHDYAGRKCPYGDKCKFEYKNVAVNKVKPATAVDYSNHTCNACGEKGHITFGCPKIKAHAADIKAATSFKGDHGWFKVEANTKKFRELVKVRGWFAARSATRFDWQPTRAADGWQKASPVQTESKATVPADADKFEAAVAKSAQMDGVDAQTSGYDDSWVDGGWCQLGWGKEATKLRLFIDLGAASRLARRQFSRHLSRKWPKESSAQRMWSRTCRGWWQTRGTAKRIVVRTGCSCA